MSILGPETAPEGDQKWDHFWNHVPPPLRESGVAFPGIVWEVCKGYWNWNYILQKKGRDTILLNFIRRFLFFLGLREFRMLGQANINWEFLKNICYFFWGDYFGYFGLFLGPLAFLGALVGAKWWGKVVGFDCLTLCQIGLILTKLC